MTVSPAPVTSKTSVARMAGTWPGSSRPSKTSMPSAPSVMTSRRAPNSRRSASPPPRMSACPTAA